MAEVVGLAFGAIGVLSLYTTCVQLFDTFQSSRSYPHDFSLSQIKVNLLRARLSRWGTSLNLETPGHEHSALIQHWPAEKEVIFDSLCGIRNIFHEIHLLLERYKAPGTSSWRSRFAIALIDKFRSHSAELPLHFNPKPQPSLLRRRTLWAVYHKEKFDRLIHDLSFIVGHLEKVVERLEACAMSSAHSSEDAKMEDGESLPDDADPSKKAASQDTQPRIDGRSQETKLRVTSVVNGETRTLDIQSQGRENITVGGDMENKGHAAGTQGAVDHAGTTIAIGGSQRNLENASGVQGTESLKAHVAALRQNQQNEIKKLRAPRD